MGEYAKLAGQEIKIGTCERMYYLRYEDRGRVDPLPGNVDPRITAGLFFRLPFPDEDNVLPGTYGHYNRGVRLGISENGSWHDWQPDDLEPGWIQLRHESGLLLNVPCYHGSRLPDVTEDMRAFWNGKSWHLELCAVKTLPDGHLRPVYHCRFCHGLWSTEWDDILPYCGNGEMRKRLESYASV